MLKSLFDWLFPYRLLIILLIGGSGFFIWAIGQYIEAVAYNSHRSDSIVPMNKRQEGVLRFYNKRRGLVDAILYCCYLMSYFLFIICGYLVGDIRGLLFGAIVGIGNFLHLRKGWTLEARIAKKREFDKRLESGELKLFG